ncbi:MAG: hypothetical protein RRX88_01575 [Raoultibacter sp.]
MSEIAYFGSYARYDTANKRDAAVLLGADSIVGDLFEIEFVLESGTRTAWIKNRFGARVGYFDAEISHQLSLCEAKDLNIVAVLSFVAFTENPEPGHYWGEAALIAYDAQYTDVFLSFIERIAEKMADGVRVDVAIHQKSLEQLVAAPTTWLPSRRVEMPARQPGTVVLKSRKKMSERVIEQGRRGHFGCYVGSWVFLLAAIALVIFGLKSCGVF